MFFQFREIYLSRHICLQIYHAQKEIRFKTVMDMLSEHIVTDMLGDFTVTDILREDIVSALGEVLTT